MAANLSGFFCAMIGAIVVVIISLIWNWWKNKSNSSYLKPNRLADIIALIQVLAFDKHSNRSIIGLNTELQGKPKSARSWNELAQDHPEFFRVKMGKDADEENETPKISLISRYVKIKNHSANTDPLSPDLAKKFLETALELHNIQRQRSERLFNWSPLIIAAITVIGSIFIQYENNRNQAFLKHYEVELKPKQESYANFMKNIGRAYYNAHTHNYVEYLKAIEESENSFYIFEPFLSDPARIHLWNDYQQFMGLCSDIAFKDSSQINNDQVFKSYDMHKNHFRTHLYAVLFDSTKTKNKE